MTKPLGLYLHIPFCRSRCAYCDFYSISRTPDTRFSEALIREIEMKSAGFKDRVCDTIYFGGGTPSTLTGMAAFGNYGSSLQKLPYFRSG